MSSERPRWVSNSSLLVLVFVFLGVLNLGAMPVKSAANFDSSDLPPLSVGDWVFRTGPSSESRLIRKIGGGKYSHIGMVVRTLPSPVIVHATTDDDPDRPNQVLLTPVEEFLQPSMARTFGIARPKFISAQQMESIAESLMDVVGEPFILAPGLDNNRYCTTLLAHAIQKEHPAFAPQWSHVDIAFYRGNYLFPTGFEAHPDIEWIVRQ